MSIRIAAAVVAAAIVIALVAAFLATHHAPVGSIPAGSDPNVNAYRTLITSDYQMMSNSTSNHCGSIQDQGCATAAGRVVVALQQWVSDLNAFQTPAKFAGLDRQLRLHLAAAASELNAAVAFQKANQANGFNLAMSAALYERAWIDPTTLAIEGTYARVVAATYHDAVSLIKQSLAACIGSTPGPSDVGCAHLSAHEACTGAAAQDCQFDVQNAETQLQTFMIGLVQNPPPSALSAKDAQLQADLVKADEQLLGITDALVKGDSRRSLSGQQAYGDAIVAADHDVAAISG